MQISLPLAHGISKLLPQSFLYSLTAAEDPQPVWLACFQHATTICLRSVLALVGKLGWQVLFLHPMYRKRDSEEHFTQIHPALNADRFNLGLSSVLIRNLTALEKYVLES